MATSQSFIHLKPARFSGQIAQAKPSNALLSTTNKYDNLLLKVHLKKFPSMIGHASSRVNRLANEDRYSVNMLRLPKVEDEILLSKRQKPVRSRNVGRSVLNMSVFDGHGGSRVAQLLTDHLHDAISNAPTDLDAFNTLLQDYKKFIGGSYWDKLYDAKLKYYERFIKNCNTKQDQVLFKDSGVHDSSGARMIFDKYGNVIDKTSLLIEQERFRLYYSFLKFDLDQCCGFGEDASMPVNERAQKYPSGSTASSIFLSLYEQDGNILDESFFLDPSSLFKLVVTQVGDSKIILCDSNGIAHSLTKIHHATSTRETKRLTSLNKEKRIEIVQRDSFGNIRFLNNYENTRSFGDVTAKSQGLSSEPDIYSYLIGPTKSLPHSEKSKMQFGGDECFITMVTDGITSLLSDQEIVDLITSTVNLRGLKTASPQFTAQEVIKFIEAVAPKHADNATCLVLRLPNWGNWPQLDRSGQSREKKLLDAN